MESLPLHFRKLMESQPSHFRKLMGCLSLRFLKQMECSPLRFRKQEESRPLYFRKLLDSLPLHFLKLMGVFTNKFPVPQPLHFLKHMVSTITFPEINGFPTIACPGTNAGFGIIGPFAGATPSPRPFKSARQYLHRCPSAPCGKVLHPRPSISPSRDLGD